jgi:signal transduction histidine kinase
MGDLVSFCRSYASEFLQDKNIKLHFDEGQISDKKIQGEVRRNIFLVLKEALNNISKHAFASAVTISFSNDENIHVEITDNGKGFTKENMRPFANGLENMKKRMEDINGSFRIESREGTTISITAPI